MPSYTVITADKAEREPVIQGKTFHCYRLHLADRIGAVELLQIPTTPAPKEGDIIEGTIEPGKQKEDGSKWPDKLKRTKTFSGGSSNSSSWDPNRSARIERQHSQEMALRYAMIKTESTGTETPTLKIAPIPTLEQIKEWTDWFEQDVASKAPTEPPKTSRASVPRIPLDRAKSILEQAQKAGLAKGTELNPTLKAKLTEVGVESGLLGHLDVDQAETIEGFIKDETHDPS